MSPTLERGGVEYGRVDALIFGQILIKLDIAPDFTTAINAVDFKLRRAYVGQIKMAEYTRGVFDQFSECSARGGKTQAIISGEVRSCVGEDERIGQEMEEIGDRILVRRVGVLDVLEHVTANAREGWKTGEQRRGITRRP